MSNSSSGKPSAKIALHPRRARQSAEWRPSAVSILADGLIPASWKIADPRRSARSDYKRKSQPPFRASDLKRAVKALRAAGIRAARIEIEPNGKLVLISSIDESGNEGKPLDHWMASRARSS